MINNDIKRPYYYLIDELMLNNILVFHENVEFYDIFLPVVLLVLKNKFLDFSLIFWRILKFPDILR